MQPTLSLFEDVISRGAALSLSTSRARMIFVVHGSVVIEGRTLADGETWHGEGSARIEAGEHGATCWRFELSGSAPASGSQGSKAQGVTSREKLSTTLDTMPDGDLLLRGDSVAFPPGGCAFLHTHQGPGIRCLIEGGIRIDTAGQSTSYGPGRRLVRGRSASGFRASRGGSPNPLHSHDDFAACARRQKFDPLCQ